MMSHAPDESCLDEIIAICNSLGVLDQSDGTYMKDRDCKPSLKEITRYLAIDHEHKVRKSLGALNIVKSDLLPLMVQYGDDTELFNTILRLLTNLTLSVLLLPKKPEKETHDRLLFYLSRYKEAFANNDRIWTTLNKYLLHEDPIVFERLLVLIRNILHIPIDSTSTIDYHDTCLNQMHKSGMLNSLIHLTQKGAEFCFHITEIIYLMLRNENPETLAKAKQLVKRRKLDDDDFDRKRYAELRERDKRQQTKLVRAHLSKHSTFVVHQVHGIHSNRPIVVGNVTRDINFDIGKDDLKKAKNAKPSISETAMSISDRNTKTTIVSVGLKSFCRRFVDSVYNEYMQTIKHNLIQKRAQDHDESYYFWALQFFSAFNRHSSFGIENISETLAMSTLHFVQMSITNYQETIKMDKKKSEETLRRLHLALRAYKEILLTIDSVQDGTAGEKTIEKLRTDPDYSNLLFNLLTQYESSKHSMHYLSDLLKANQIFIKLQRTQDLMNRYCCPPVLRAYTIMLEQYETNDSVTNTAIIEFLEQLVNYGQAPQLFQASLFRILLKIMNHDKRYDALARQLFSSFGEMANKKRWMYQELLFWKTSNDIIEIQFAFEPPPPEPTEPAYEPYEAADADPDEALERISVISELPSLNDIEEIIDPPEEDDHNDPPEEDDHSVDARANSPRIGTHIIELPSTNDDDE